VTVRYSMHYLLAEVVGLHWHSLSQSECDHWCCVNTSSAVTKQNSSLLEHTLSLKFLCQQTVHDFCSFLDTSPTLKIKVPYFPVDNVHLKLFWHSIWCIDNAHPIPRMFIFYEFRPFV
jgi:hypothetical protein